MTGGGGAMTTSASMHGRHLQRSQAPSWILGDGRGKGKEGMGKKTKGKVRRGEEGEKGGGRKKGRGKKEERKGEN